MERYENVLLDKEMADYQRLGCRSAIVRITL